MRERGRVFRVTLDIQVPDGMDEPDDWGWPDLLDMPGIECVGQKVLMRYGDNVDDEEAF